MSRIGSGDVVLLVGGQLGAAVVDGIRAEIEGTGLQLVDVLQDVVSAQVNTDHPVTGGAAHVVAPRRDGKPPK